MIPPLYDLESPDSRKVIPGRDHIIDFLIPLHKKDWTLAAIRCITIDTGEKSVGQV
jgi:hypothetical protein